MTFKQLKQYRGSLSLGLMIIITGITQVLTLMKSSLVAGIFGTGVEIDAYNLANSIVSFLFGFIAAGISTVIIPNYVRKTDRRNVDSFITVLYGLIALIVGILIAFRYQIIGLFSNRDELFVNICCNALIVLLLANYLLAISDVTVAYFQCNPFLLAMSIAMFNIARNIHFKNRFINYISKLSLLIYIIHENIILEHILDPQCGIMFIRDLDIQMLYNGYPVDSATLIIAALMPWNFEPFMCSVLVSYNVAAVITED